MTIAGTIGKTRNEYNVKEAAKILKEFVFKVWLQEKEDTDPIRLEVLGGLVSLVSQKLYGSIDALVSRGAYLIERQEKYVPSDIAITYSVNLTDVPRILESARYALAIDGSPIEIIYTSLDKLRTIEGIEL